MANNYTTLRIFKPSSGLQQYLAKRKSNLITLTVSSYRLSTILLAIKEIIEEEKLFDTLNRAIIVFNPELERIFRVNVLHVSQLLPKVEELLHPKNGREITISLEIANREVETMNFFASVDNEITQTKSFHIASKYISVEPILVTIFKNEGLVPKKAGSVMKAERFQKVVEDYINLLMLRDSRNSAIIDLRGNPLKALINKNYATSKQVMEGLKDHVTHWR